MEVIMEITRHMLSENLTYAIGWTMLHSLWQGLAVALFAGLILRLRNDMPARQRYMVAFMGLIAVLILAAATFIWLYRPVHVVSFYMPKAIEDAAYQSVAPEIASGSPWMRIAEYFNAHMQLVVQLWFVGLAFFTVRLIGGVAYAQRLRRRSTCILPPFIQEKAGAIASRIGIKRAVRVLESALLQTPAVIGWLKPVILLPIGMINRLTTDQVEAVLAHELAHIRRNDYLFNLLQTFIEAVFYFNPAVWILSAAVRREREHSCDDVALSICGNSLAYAKALLQIQESQVPPPRMAMALRRKKGPLLLRIQRILQPSIKPSSDIMEKITVTGLLMAAVFALSVRATNPATFPVESADPAVIALDSLPPGKIRINTNDDGERMEARIENRKLVYLRINDKEIPEAELPKYESYVEKKLNETPPPPPPPAPAAPPAPPAPGVVPAPPAPGAPPAPPAPRMREKSVTVEIDDDGNTIVRTQEGEAKGIVRSRIYAPEITIIRDNDTTVIISPEGLMDIEKELEIAFERQGRALRLQEGDLERQAQEMERLGREFKWQERDMERQAIEMERQARGMNREAREMEIIEREMTENDRRMKREFDLSIAPGTISFSGPGGRGNAQSALENELFRDGLITDRNKYKMELSAGSLKVNGKKMPEGLARKYQQLYEDRSGISLSKGGKVIIEK